MNDRRGTHGASVYVEMNPFVLGSHLIRHTSWRRYDTFSHWRRQIAACLFRWKRSLAGVAFRFAKCCIHPLQRWKIGHTKRLQDRRGITYTDVRSRGGGRYTREYSMSPFRHIDEAAKSRRLPRGWLDSGGRACFNYFRTAEVGGNAPMECVSTRLFPRSGTQWRHFLIKSFSRKSLIVYDI